MRLAAGRLDRLIDIQRSSAASNAFNEPILSWSLLAQVYAEVTPMTDGERLRAGEKLASKMSRFVVRYATEIADLNPRDQIIYDGRTYEIQAVKEIERRQGFEITATARGE